MKIEAIDLKKLREQLSNWRASAPANLHPSYILDALAPQVIALLDEIDRLRTDVDLRGPDGACCRARRRAEDQLVAMTQARNEACEWWELHLKGFAKRQGDPDGGILREHECLERTKKIGLYMDPDPSTDHWTVQCECGEHFDSRPTAMAHAKEQLHRMRGLFFAERLEVEEHFHTCGICTHVPQALGGGVVTACVATTPVTHKDGT